MLQSIKTAWRAVVETDRYPAWLCWILIPLLCLPINWTLVQMAKSLL